jgi:hypothetical protein
VSDKEDIIEEGVRPHLDDGETVLATLQAAVRGHTGAVQPGLAGMIVGRKVKKNIDAGNAVGLVVKSPMGVVLTDRRLLTLDISTSKAMGKATGVNDVLSAIPLADVTAIEAKRMGLAGVVQITARGAEVKLEAPSVGKAKALAEAWAATRATA